MALPTAPATTASVTASATSVTLAAANAKRRFLSITNNGSTVLYVNWGATASATANRVQIAAGASVDLPVFYDGSGRPGVYKGVISGIWAGSPTGSAQVTSINV